MPSVDESEAHCRRQQARFLLREDFVFFMLARDASGGEGELVGATGLHRIDWTLRKFEIGYWRKTGCEGRGFVTEAVRALARLAFDTLARRRVEIRMDDNNAASSARRRARRLHPRGPAALRFRDACGRPAQHAGLCACARCRGADGAGRLGAAAAAR
jgi:hypothetical protein